MRTSEGGLSRAQRDHVALATARRASIEDARNPLSPTTFEKPAFKAGFFRLKFMRMRTFEGGLSRAQRDHVALATARRASIADARNPLSPTTFEKPAFKAGFFSSKVYEDENLRRRPVVTSLALNQPSDDSSDPCRSFHENPDSANTAQFYLRPSYSLLARVLHTKGSHYQYSQRYPRSFARYTPECMGVDRSCSKAQLINAFDNSVLYTDTFIGNVIDSLRDKKAVVFYAADHGESIDENSHLHGTPRQMAPDEQFRVPMIAWASDSFLAQPDHQEAFDRLKAQQRVGGKKRHEELFDSILGCLGYTSPDGGINPANNWCAKPQSKTVTKSFQGSVSASKREIKSTNM